MEPYADLGCVLAVDIDCRGCKRKVMEVLSSIIGVYDVLIDAKTGLVKVTGEVDPNVLLDAISRTGSHAKLVWAKFNHPQVSRSNYGYGCRHRTPLPECSRPRGGSYGYGDYYPFRTIMPDWPLSGRSYFSRAVPLARFRTFGF